MAYQIVVPSNVQKDLDSIEARQRARIIKAFDELESNPFVGKKLRGEHSGERTYRVWPYRIIYRIERARLIVLIIRIGHRQGVY